MSSALREIVDVMPTLDHAPDEHQLLWQLSEDQLALVLKILKKCSYEELSMFETLLSQQADSDYALFNSDLTLLSLIATPTLMRMERYHHRKKTIPKPIFNVVFELRSALRDYWGSQDLHLEWSKRENFARGELLSQLVTHGYKKPQLDINHDIFMQFIGEQLGCSYSYVEDEHIDKLMQMGELTLPLDGVLPIEIVNEWDRVSSKEYAGLSLLSEDDVQKLDMSGGSSLSEAARALDIDVEYKHYIDQIARNKGYSSPAELPSILFAERLLELYMEWDSTLDYRRILAICTAMDEKYVVTAMERMDALPPECLSVISEEFFDLAFSPHHSSTHDRQIQLTHAIRMAPIVYAFDSVLGEWGDEISLSLTDSLLSMEDREPTEEEHTKSKGIVVQFYVEHSDETANQGLEHLDDETLLWLGTHSEQLAHHAATLRDHGKIDRALYEEILSSSVLSSGVL